MRMSPEGEIVVRLDWNGATVERVRVASTRRDAAARLLTGRTAADVLAWVPRVFSLCASAQGMAARLALEHAGADVPRATVRLDVDRETVHEYFFRLLIDWPRAVGEPGDAATVAQARRTAGERLGPLAADRMFGEPPGKWLARRDLDDLEAWTARGTTLPARLLATLLREAPDLGRSDVDLMPEPTRQALERSVLPAMAADDAFCRTPTWDGAPRETGALARMRGHPLVAALVARHGHTAAARMTARLVELALLLERATSTWTAGFSPRPDQGVGAVQTARGLLLHSARMSDGRVVDYRILAPTEWNFHPQGPLARGLRGLAARAREELERHARLAVHALDPCVACSLEVAHA